MTVSLAIVVSEFNGEITFKMLDRAKDEISKLGASLRYVCYVPGAFDMPLMVEELLKKNGVDAVVTLGAVIKGDTRHDDLVAENSARLLADLSLKYCKPVALGISGPGMTEDQAVDRIGPVSTRAVRAAINMVTRTNRLRTASKRRASDTVIIDDTADNNSN